MSSASSSGTYRFGNFFNLSSSIAFLCFWKLDITSNTSCEDTSKSQGESEGGKKGGKRGGRGDNVEHLCKVIAAAQASVQRGGKRRKHIHYRSCLTVCCSEKEIVMEEMEANDDEKKRRDDM